MPNFKNRKSKRAKIFGPRGKAPISSRIEIIWGELKTNISASFMENDPKSSGQIVGLSSN